MQSEDIMEAKVISAKTVLHNRQAEFGFSEQGRLEYVEEKTRNRRLELKSGSAGLWQLTFRAEDGSLKQVHASQAALTKVVQPAVDRLEFEWRIPDLKADVKCRIGLDETALVQWEIEVTHRSGLSLWAVQYPIIGGLGFFAGDGEGDRLLAPWNDGVEFVNPVALVTGGKVSKISWMSEFAQCDTEEGVHKLAFSYPGMWAHQLLALYHPDRLGLYFAAHDGEARFKRFGLYQDSPDTVALIMVNFPDERIQPDLNYKMPYPVRVGPFVGPWHAAARLYRAWAVNQTWCRKGPVLERDDLPRWLVENDFWHWNWASHMKDIWNAMPELYTPALVELKKRLDCNMAVHWYGSDCRPFNTAVPELFPIGETHRRKLKKGLDLLHRNDIHAMPYFNPRLCDPDTITWEQCRGADLACRTDTDAPHEERYMEGKSWITMCPTQLRWQEVVFDIVQECMGLGYDGVYVDQISACFAVPCFSAKHGHPRGGGNTWYQGNKRLMELIQSRLKTPATCFTSESTIECYNDVFEANLARSVTRVEYGVLGDERAWPVPLSASIYHDYAMTYGSMTILHSSTPDTVYLGGALNLLSGNQLCFEGYTLKDIKQKKYEDYLAYYHDLCQFRKKYRRYFNGGEWLPPPEMTVSSATLNLSAPRPVWSAPTVLAGAWQLGGRRLVYAVNHTANEQLARLRLDDREEEWRVPPRGVIGREI